MSFSAENRRIADRIVAQYPQSESAVLPLLHLAQSQDGWLSPDGMREVAEILGLEPAQVFSVASFYTMYLREPAGKKIISVCNNISCMLQGSDELLERIEHRLGSKCGHSTSGGEVYLEEVECLAACGGAPCLQVDGEYFENVTIEAADSIVDSAMRGERPEGGKGLPSDFYSEPLGAPSIPEGLGANEGEGS
ncbi:MAG: NADH-quinone oxidoreductase subunit NuoE [Acidobacteria bacterium]|nr:MAG: NADH-quinone oxidoreductase subunit NuoE [Acidobacteriota bacterium]